MRVAVTGAAGQIGSALLRRMLEDNALQPIAICRNVISAGIVEHTAPGSSIRIGSITEADSAERMFEGADAILHCALGIAPRRAQASRRLNQAMIENISRAKDARVAVFLSSIAVYGRTSLAGTFENLRPNSEYGRSKRHMEKLAQRAWSANIPHWYILRVGHVVGPNLDHSRNILESAGDKDFRLPADARASNTVHIDNLVADILSLLSGQIEPGIYNAVDDEETWRSVFDWHTEAAGLAPVKSLPSVRASEWAAIYRSPSIFRDVTAWFRTLSLVELARHRTILEAATRVLRPMPEFFTERVETLYKRRLVKGELSASIETSAMTPLFVLDPVPGRSLAGALKTRRTMPEGTRAKREIAEWASRFSDPFWLPRDRDSRGDASNAVRSS